MWTHYLKIAARHLGRQPEYALLNILGLAIGMSCVMPILLKNPAEILRYE